MQQLYVANQRCAHAPLRIYWLLLFFFICIHTQAQIITTIAGSGAFDIEETTFNISGNGGPATTATLGEPWGVATDGLGNLYFSDHYSALILKVDTAGIIAIFAGNGAVGNTGDGGPATAAEIEAAFGVAADVSGNVYIAGYSGNGSVRKVNTSGIISTIAGGGSVLGDGGPATAANIDAFGVAVDGAGNVYIADEVHQSIRKVNTSGIITTIAGTGTAGFSGDGGPATAANLNEPYGVAVDGIGNVYIADLSNHRIRKVNTSGIITTIAGNGGTVYSGDGGPATAATVPDAWGVAADGFGNIYVPDHSYHHIRQINAAGIIINFAGNGTSGFTGDGGLATAAEISEPIGVGVDNYGNVYIPDLHNARIRKVNGHNRLPYFTGGHSQNITVCESSTGDPINAQLAVFDSDAYQQEVWSLVTPPAHGAAAVADTIVSASDTLHTAGLYYTPVPGYTGSDSFKVRVTDGMASDTTTIYVAFNPAPAAITGAAAMCPGAAVTLSDATAGGAWSSGNTAIATLVPIAIGTNVVTGVAAGTAAISYTLLSDGCPAIAVVTVNMGATAISGIASACAGATTTLSDGASGGAWSSGNTAVATVGSTGIVSSILHGTATITYTIASGCSPATTVVTVYPLPSAISGTSICGGTTITLTDAITGGVWSSSNTGVASVGSASGMVTGGNVPVTSTATITYTAPGGCPTAAVVTVNPQPSAISGANNICAGAASTLTDGAGGAWSSGNTAVATIGSTGIITGVALGTAGITYTLPAGCAATTTITVNLTPSAIIGTTAICSGTTTTLSDGTTGGTWSSNNTGVASIDAATGNVTTSGFSFGTAIISYTLGGGCAATEVVTVNIGPLPISGTLSLCGGGATTYLSDGIGSGTWSGGNTAVATIDGTGVVYGVAAGTAVVSYTYGACTVTATVTVSPTPFLIIGPPEICLGLTTNLTDATTGGVWSSSNTGMATVNAAGTFFTAATGATVISYTLPGGCATTKTITVGTTPAAITGTMKVCAGSVTALTDAGGGTWSSGSSGVATVGSASGMVSGIIPGTAAITYSLGAGCSVTTQVTVNPLPNAVTGAFTVCAGSTTALTDAGGGTWSSSNTTTATVAAGTVGGIIAGTAGITYTLPTGCTAMQIITVNPLPAMITGTVQACSGSTTNLTETTTGGAWSSGTTTIATAGSAGTVTAILPGTTTITYTLGTGCKRTATVTVNPLPANITGTMNLCAGAAAALSDAVSGGVWSPAAGAIASVNAVSGVVTGVSAGSAAITYTLTTGCLKTTMVTVNALPAAISGPSAVCAGAAMAETDSPPGGAWSSSVTTVATIGSTGIITGITTGTSAITYISTAGCKAGTTITVSLSPTAISGLPAVCAGDSISLSDTVGGGLWSSGNTAAATVGSLTGTVTGIAAGTTTITYSLGTGCTVTKLLTVNPAPAAITGMMSMCAGSAITLSESATGGVWSSSNTTVVSVIGTGMVTGATAGTAMISCTLTATGCAAAAMVTVNLTPTAITGTAHLCPGATTTLSEGVSGGVWTSSATTVATVIPVVSGTVAVIGIAPGTATITYALGSCTATQIITVNSVSAIIGATGVCVGNTTSLSDATTGGAWSSGTTAVASVNAVTGLVTGALSGTSVITYTTAAGCAATATVIVNLAPSAISGTLHVCVGDTTALGNLAGGGTWTGSNTAVATVVTSTGVVTGVAPGTTVITYSLGTGCTVTATITVNPSPASVMGTTAICAGAATTLSDATTGGAWSISSAGIATISSAGMVTGLSGGTATVTYTPATGCAAVKHVTVNPLSVVTGTVPMPVGICAGLTTTLSSTITGGTWSSSNTGIATADPANGVVTGVAPGPATITYTLPTGCAATITVTINAAPQPISGATAVCIGSATALSDPSGGGAWSSSNTAVATVTGTGMVSSVATGTATVSYTLGGCPAVIVVTVNSLPGAITGTTQICAGSATPLTDLPGGGAWSTSNTATANVDAVTGTVTGIAPGMAVITYSLGAGCTVAATVTVNPLPPPITGNPAICAGYTTTLSDGGGSGVWSSDNTAVATVTAGGVVHGLTGGGAIISYTNGAGGCAATRIVTVTLVPAITGITNLCAYSGTLPVYDSLPGGNWTSTLATISSSGIVTPYSTGVATITYTLPTGCFTTAMLTVNPLPGPITGIIHFCAGLAMALNDTTAGGVWSSSNAAVASINASGTLTGLSAGTATVSYAMAGGCAQTVPVTIDTLPSAGAITGASTVCAGASITLTDAAAGGAWSGSNASAGVSGGIVSGIAAGTDTIKYTNSNTCGTAAVTKTITVNPLPVAGTITGDASLCAGDSIVLADAVSGGVWSSSSATATVSEGNVRGISGGTNTISYSVTNSCGTAIAIETVTVNALPAPGMISGADTICTGASFTLLDTAAGGVWSGSNAAVTVTSGGLVSAVSAGLDTITYSITNMCGTATASFVIAVKTIPEGVTITGAIPMAAGICIGAKDTLTGTPQGGNWSVSNTNAVINGGIISGVMAGVDTVIYIISSTCGPAVALYPVMVWSVEECDSMTASPGLSRGEEVLRVWPNPNDGAFTVMLSSATDEPVHITITTLVGERVKDFISSTNKPSAVKLDEAGGVYFVNAFSAGGNYVVKVVVTQ